MSTPTRSSRSSFLKRIGRTGFGECLFYDWRADPAFVLNDERYRGATILLAGRNFGCGSSREHAAWALRDFGFRAILAESFADIFVANCTNNGIAAIAVDVDEIAQHPRLTIDLEQCEIRDDRGFIAPFDIDPFRRERLLHGYDEIALTLRYESKIAEFEPTPPQAVGPPAQQTPPQNQKMKNRERPPGSAAKSRTNS